MFAKTLEKLLRSQSALSRARSLLIYLYDMWLRHNLKISLRRNSLCSFSRRSLMKLLAIRLSLQAGEEANEKWGKQVFSRKTKTRKGNL